MQGFQLPRLSRKGDVIAISILIAAIVGVMVHRWIYDDWLNEYDILTFFVPWFGMTGERLRDFSIPGWTPSFLSGTSLVGDPSGGWMYLPVMFAFTIFPAVLTAFKVMILTQLLIGGLATYGLARRIGMDVLAALTSASAFTFGPWLFAQTDIGTVGSQVATWIPVALLAIECALRSPVLVRKLAWWSLGGVALSQMAVSWPGQGMISAYIIVAGWIGYRALLSPPLHNRLIRDRLLDGIFSGVASFGFGLGFGAAGILPRLTVNSESSIAGGDYRNVVGGDYNPPLDFLSLLKMLNPIQYFYRTAFIEGAVITLAILALFLAGRRYATPFFAGMFVLGCILTQQETIVHRVFYLIPQFERLHEHSPNRLIWMLPLALPMLAGAAVQSILDLKERHWRTLPILLVPLGVLGIADIVMHRHDIAIDPETWLSAILVTLAVAIAIIPWPGSRTITAHAPRLAMVGAILVVVALPTGNDIVNSFRGATTVGAFTKDEETQSGLDTYVSRTDPGGAGEFLQNLAATTGPFRIVSYAGRDTQNPGSPSYSTRRLEPGVLATLLNGRTPALGLESIQGYNPTHFLIYDEFFTAMDGGQQNYHWSDPFLAAFDQNPLLDMLNVRYILVAANLPADDPFVRTIAEGREEVFRSDKVIVFQNATAFDRAWIVHDVRPEIPESLAQFRNGLVDGRKVAFVDGELPPVIVPPDPNAESVTISKRSADSLTAHVIAATPGLVVFSEIDESGWNAYVDGRRTDILRTNHALRGIAISPGVHTIVMRYEPESLRIGLWLSGITLLAMVTVTTLAIYGWQRDRRASDSGSVFLSRTPSREMRQVRGIAGYASA